MSFLACYAEVSRGEKPAREALAKFFELYRAEISPYHGPVVALMRYPAGEALLGSAEPEHLEAFLTAEVFDASALLLGSKVEERLTRQRNEMLAFLLEHIYRGVENDAYQLKVPRLQSAQLRHVLREQETPFPRMEWVRAVAELDNADAFIDGGQLDQAWCTKYPDFAAAIHENRAELLASACDAPTDDGRWAKCCCDLEPFCRAAEPDVEAALQEQLAEEDATWNDFFEAIGDDIKAYLSGQTWWEPAELLAAWQPQFDHLNAHRTALVAAAVEAAVPSRKRARVEIDLTADQIVLDLTGPDDDDAVICVW
jgi:hypothetical protein